MNDNFEKAAEQAAAFQKMWLETVSKMMQATFAVTPNSPPADVLRQMRGGIFQALAESWEEFMRSPQFLEGMRQWMENTVTFRKMTNDLLAKVRNELQAPSRDDIDTIMLTIRHMEKRILDRVDELATQVNALNQRLSGDKAMRPSAQAGAGKRRSPKAAAESKTGTNKTEVA